MGAAKIPANQQDAMPLLSTTDATQPDSVAVVGNTLLKYWAPGTNGILGTMGAIGTIGRFGIIGNWLDMRGMSQWTFMLQRNMADAASEAVAQPTFYAQGRAGVAGYFDASSSTAFDNAALRLVVADFGSTWNVTGGPYPYSRVCTRAFANEGQPAFGQPGPLIGSDLRFTLEFSAASGGGGLTWALHIWAQGP